MSTEKNKKKGLLILCLATAGFFFFWYFDLSDTPLKGISLSQLLQMIFTSAIPICGLYFGLSVVHSKKVAKQISVGLAAFLLIAYILGFLLH